jgi:hypothetical protein
MEPQVTLLILVLFLCQIQLYIQLLIMQDGVIKNVKTVLHVKCTQLIAQLLANCTLDLVHLLQQQVQPFMLNQVSLINQNW